MNFQTNYAIIKSKAEDKTSVRRIKCGLTVHYTVAFLLQRIRLWRSSKHRFDKIYVIITSKARCAFENIETLLAPLRQ